MSRRASGNDTPYEIEKLARELLNGNMNPFNKLQMHCGRRDVALYRRDMYNCWMKAKR